MHTLPLAFARWSFRDVTKRSAWRQAIVPGCVHRDLLRLKQLPDLFWGTNEALVQWVGEHQWEYRASFKVTAALLAEEVVDLVADGLDTVATVFLNGHEIARTENMFTGYRWDVRPVLRPGKNELRILFGSAPEYIRTHRTSHNPSPEFNDPVGGCTRIRKQQCQFGWDWGPRFITAGIWRDIRLESWSVNRLASVRVAQTHTADGPVSLDLTPELARAGDVTLAWELSLDGELVHEGEGTRIVVTEPQLWWPNGQGAQPLYELKVVATQDGREIGRWARRIGLRTVVLDRRADQWGESFQFVVNGRPIFAKGANWIPAHSLPAGLTRADYARDLIAAAQVHMNMVRVWGGGIYESEDFYDLCDELGLLVWQDFMFACTLYPGDAEFQALVRDEAAFQIARLRHRACLALWCGNNEVYGCNAHQIDEASPAWADYQAIFHRVLPEALAAHDGVTSYWPSSPWRGRMGADYDLGAERGDTHYWDVWHSRKSVQEYELRPFRFCSEYGMQSYSSPETQATFCPGDDANVFGPTMENHQKNRFGNQIILDYVSRRYRFPKDQNALIYLSQVNQAHCMQVGTEFYRRSTPRCMGALYWQINDCWPVASWSSIEFTGRWKALHHVARRFFSPALVSAQVHGAETTITGNYHRNSIAKVDLYTVYDAPEATTGLLRWDLFHLDGRILSGGHQRVALRYGESFCQRTLDLGKLLAKHGHEHVYLRIALDLDGICVSEDTVFLASPRFLALPKAKTKVTLRALSPTQTLLTFQSPVFQHRFAFDLPGLAHHATDNWFDLYPGEKKEVLVELDWPATKAQLQKKLRYRSLVDSY